MHEIFLHILLTFGATNFKRSEYNKSTKWEKKDFEKASFSLMPCQNGFYIFQNSYIILFHQMHYLNIAKHRCIHERKLKSIAFFNTFLFIPLIAVKTKIQII